MCEFRKPPMGVKPSWLAATERIKELADGISRYAGYNGSLEDKTAVMRVWASEIIWQCNIVDKLQNLKNERGGDTNGDDKRETGKLPEQKSRDPGATV